MGSRTFMSGLAVCLSGISVLGCSGGSSSRGATAAPVASASTGSATTSTAPVVSSAPVPRTPLDDVHGTLTELPVASGGAVLGFQPDGATDAYEIESGLLGGAAGDTLVLSGSAGPNDRGLSAEPEAIRITAQQLDDVRVIARLYQIPTSVDPAEPVFLYDSEERVFFDPTGPLTPALTDDTRIRNSGTNSDFYYIVTGRRGPPSTSPGARNNTDTLEVTSWRFAERIDVMTFDRDATTGLSNRDLRFSVDDLVSDARYRDDGVDLLRPVPQGRTERRVTVDSRGRLDDAQRTALRRAVLAADLGNLQGTRFPAVATPGVPVTSIVVRGAQRPYGIGIEDGALLPPTLAALMNVIRSIRNSRPGSSTLEQGIDSAITRRITYVIRDTVQWTGVWNQHRANNPAPVPAIDFNTQVVIAMFAGSNPTPINDPPEVVSTRVDGQDLRITTRPGGTSQFAPVTTHFQIRVVELRGLTGSIYLDGVRR